MITAGIDYGVYRVAVAVVLEDGSNVTFDIDTRGRPKDPAPELVDTLKVLDDQVRLFLEPFSPTLVAVERAITGGSGNAKTAAQMAMVAGVMVLAAARIGADVVLIAPSSWKKNVCGYGSYDKAGVRRWVEAERPDLAAGCTTQDTFDATCLALAARQVLEGTDGVLEGA